tara:strand:- start:21 stop:614 length:594 start_codon:yes stop_codon:yes gene_type:complete
MNNTTNTMPLNTNNGLFSIFSSIIANNTDTHNNGASEEFKNNLEEHTVDEEFIKNKKQCSICLDDFKLGDKYIRLPCHSADNESQENHVFHSGNEMCSGIKPWLERNNTCPMCRKEFPRDNNPILSGHGRTRDVLQSITFHTAIIPPTLNNNDITIPDPNDLENTFSNIIANYINEIEENNEQRDIQLAIEASLIDT